MESVLCSIWQVDVRNLVVNKLYICRDYHIQPSEIDKMAYFEYEYIWEEIKKEQKEQEKRQKEEEKKYGTPKMPNYNQLMSSVGKSMPSLPNFSIPKI